MLLAAPMPQIVRGRHFEQANQRLLACVRLDAPLHALWAAIYTRLFRYTYLLVSVTVLVVNNAATSPLDTWFSSTARVSKQDTSQG